MQAPVPKSEFPPKLQPLVQAKARKEEDSLWSENEKETFLNSIRIYGKNFFQLSSHLPEKVCVTGSGLGMQSRMLVVMFGGIGL